MCWVLRHIVVSEDSTTRILHGSHLVSISCRTAWQRKCQWDLEAVHAIELQPKLRTRNNIAISLILAQMLKRSDTDAAFIKTLIGGIERRKAFEDRYANADIKSTNLWLMARSLGLRSEGPMIYENKPLCSEDSQRVEIEGPPGYTLVLVPVRDLWEDDLTICGQSLEVPAKGFLYN